MNMPTGSIRLHISQREYEAIDAVSRSDLMQLRKSLKHYLHSKTSVSEPTYAMVIGIAFHCLILEPEIFNDHYYVMEPNIDRRTKQGKELYETATHVAAGRTILKREEMDNLEAMKKSIMENTVVKATNMFGDGGKTEVAMCWTAIDSMYKEVACKCRLDKMFLNGQSSIIELKTTSNAINFENEIFDRAYHIQAAFYMDAFENVFAHKCDSFIFVAVEKEPPYYNSVHTIHKDSVARDIGRQEYKMLLSKYLKEKENGFEVEDVLNEVSVPSWYIKRHQDTVNGVSGIKLVKPFVA